MTQHRRMSREERRKQILASALKVFIEKGYDRSTTLDIAKEAQVSEVTLFRHFESKRLIFMEAIEPVLLESFQESIKKSRNLGPVGHLEQIFKSRVEFVSEHQAVIKLILMESQINPEVGDFDFINQMTSLMRSSIKEAGIQIRDEDFAVRLIVGGILSFLYLPKLNDEEIDLYTKKLIKKIID